MRRIKYTVLVTGGRDYADSARVYSFLDTVAFLYGHDITLVHGGCPTGADSFAEAWAKSREQTHLCIPAEWKKYGKGAGPERNAEMAIVSGAHAVVAFRGNRGTEDMISLVPEMRPKAALILPDGEFWK